MKALCSTLAGILLFVALIPYVRSIRRGTTKPMKSTWIIWAALDVLTLSAMLAKGAVNGLIISAVVGACTVAILSIKKGVPGWARLDKVCLIGAGLGITLWILFRNPLAGLVTGLAVLLVGSVPTWVSAWRDPGRENKLSWTIGWLASLIACIGVPHWNVANSAQPITFVIIESVMMYLLFLRRT